MRRGNQGLVSKDKLGGHIKCSGKGQREVPFPAALLMVRGSRGPCEPQTLQGSPGEGNMGHWGKGSSGLRFFSQATDIAYLSLCLHLKMVCFHLLPHSLA